MEQNLHFTFVSLYNSICSTGIEPAYFVLSSEDFKVSQIFFGERRFISQGEITLSEYESGMLIDKLRQLHPNIIIFNVRSFLLPVAKWLTQRIQQELNIPVIWGGSHPTVCPEESIQIADIICMGEGEEAILELAEKLSKDEDITNIRNLWIRKADKVIKNSLRPPLENLDWIPVPDFKQEIYYIDKQGIRKQSSVYEYFLSVSRGCPFDCSFCNDYGILSQYPKSTNHIRIRSVDDVINELSGAKEYLGIKNVYFYDGVFDFDLEWMRSFCRKYKKEIGLPFFCYLHPLTVNKEKLDLLIDAGLTKVDMGIPSGSQRVSHKVFNRCTQDIDILNAANLLSKYRNLMITYDLIADNPYETDVDKRKALNLFLKLPLKYNILVLPLYFFPKTRLTEKALADGIITQKEIVGQNSAPLKQLTKNYRDYRGGKQEQSWFVLLNLLDDSYEGHCIYPRWIIRLLGSSRYLRSDPRLLQRIASIIGFLSKGIIYYKKYGLKYFLKKFFVKLISLRHRLFLILIMHPKNKGIESVKTKSPS